MTEPLASAATLVERAHAALTAQIGQVLPGVEAQQDATLPLSAAAVLFLNVVKSARPPEVQAECMGVEEDESEIEFVQTFMVEWIVREEDGVSRAETFSQGLAAVDAAIRSDRTLGGVARGVTLGPPSYDVNPLITSPATKACLIPVRVALRGRSLLA